MEYQVAVQLLTTEHRIELEVDPDVLLECLTSLSNLTGRFGPEDQFRIEELSTHGWQLVSAEWSEPSELAGQPRIILGLTRTDLDHAPGGAPDPGAYHSLGKPADPGVRSS